MSDAAWVRKWLDRALDDMESAQHLYAYYRPKKLEISCYQCQQAAEKALKAYLTQADCAFPFTHDCRQLCMLCAGYEDGFNEYLTDCARLTPYATQARYPDNDEITEAETQAALRKAERIVTFCSSLIPPAPPVDAE
jgi:HEPN domain-containing protein